MKRLLTMAVLLLASAGFAQTTIGVNLELSGRFAPIGNTTLQGIETALLLSGAENIELSICDNETTVEGSVACANRFIDEGVTAVLGPISTTQALPAASTLQDAGIIMVTTSSTNPATTQVGDHIFRMAYTDDFQGSVAANYALDELSAQNAIVFREQSDDYSFGLASSFIGAFEAGGGSVVTADYVKDTVDFTAQINDVLGIEADVIYIPGFCAEASSLVPSLRAAGFEQQLLGGDGLDDSQCPDGGGEAFNGFIFTGFGGADVLEGEAATRATDFESEFILENPDYTDFNGFTLAGADSMNVMVEALNQAGEGADDDAVLEALSNIEGYPGVSGEITYAGTDGTPADRTIAFFEYEVPADNDQGWASNSLFGRQTGEAAAGETMDDEAMDDEAMDDEAMDDEAMDDETMEDEDMEDEDTEEEDTEDDSE